MLDIETLGTRSNSVVAVIAAVYFNPISGETGDEFYKRIDLKSCVDLGLEIDAETIKWWINQSSEAQFEIFNYEKREVIEQALRKLNHFITNQDEVIIWGNSPRFDCGLLENIYDKLALKPPWKYWNERDLRTLVSLAPSCIAKNITRKGIHHNALDDCYHQIRICAKIKSYLSM